MQNAVNRDASVQSCDQDDGYHSIIANLVSLVGHIQASVKQIELAIAGEIPSFDPDTSSNIVVLDDVTPRYVRANAVLKTCKADIGAALHFLLDTERSAQEARTLARRV